ncbi:MAG: segregation/condensation protein A [Spirochaetaceae bacterium]|nr:MAG: segregation/condensation protein A [Spirochaetaceae bacterium]
MTVEETSQAHHVRLQDFEGPMDLLLFLIKRSEINIYDIPISQITEQYLQFLDYAAKVELEHITEFYVMAATLLYIKSRMLLPVEMDLDDEIEDPRKELVERLIEYQKYKIITDMMSDKEQESEWLLERRRKQEALPFEDSDELWETIDVWELLRTFSTIISNVSSDRLLDLYEEVSVNEKLSLLEELLETRSDCLFTDLIVKPGSIMEVVCAFLAILESVKSRRIDIEQNRMFGDIRIRRREHAA